MIAMPTQLVAADWLASKRRALLADEPRVGKTGAAILAADKIFAKTIGIITTASGRAVWRRAFGEWSAFPRSIGVYGVDRDAKERDITIVSWQGADKLGVLAKDLWICDEDHAAKNPYAKRTQAVFGRFTDGGARILDQDALTHLGGALWHLTGTPLPHDPSDTWVRLRVSAPGLLKTANGWPDVTLFEDFKQRYCIVRMKKLKWNSIPVVVGGRNLEELRERMRPFMLRRTQKDIGIRPPSYDLMPLIVSEARRRECAAPNEKAIIEAIDAGRTKELDMELGPLRRITGRIKAGAVIEAVKEEFEGGLDKIVLAYFHREVGNALIEGLAQFGVCRIDGSSNMRDRENAERAFRQLSNYRVMLAQIDAAGEAIDLSAASVLWFVESVFSPKSMQQMSLRITNINQKRNCFVKVCCIEGSIDEAIQESLMRLWAAINGALGK